MTRPGLLVSMLALVGACAPVHTESVNASTPGSVPVPSAGLSPVDDSFPSATPPGSVGAPSLAFDDAESRGLTRTQPGTIPEAPDWNRVFATLGITAHLRDGGLAFVGSKSTLHSGESIDLHVAVARDAYVTLVQLFPSGKASVLYPVLDEPSRIPSGVFARIPTDPRVDFVLDEDTGTERLALIASQQPIDRANADLGEALRQLAASGRWKEAPSLGAGSPSRAQGSAPGTRMPPKVIPRIPPDPRNSPAAPDARDRGLSRTGRAADLTLEEGGWGIVWVTFNHVP